jgi:hypothetical protein
MTYANTPTGKHRFRFENPIGTGWSAVRHPRAAFVPAIGILLLYGQAAPACVAPIRFNPARDRYDIAFVGTVANPVRSITNDYSPTADTIAEIRIGKVMFGRFPHAGYRLQTGSGSTCGPNGPSLRKGDGVIVYLRKSAGPDAMPWYPISWRRITR